MATSKASDLSSGQSLTNISLLDFSIADLNAALSTSKKKTEHCKIHTEQYLYFYCNKCHEPVCRDCTVVTHKDLNGHRIYELKDIFQDYSKQFSKQSEVAEADKKVLEKYKNNLQKKIEDTDSMKRRLKREIQDDLKKNIKTLKERAVRLCEEINKDCDSQKESLERKLQEISKVKDEIDAQLADFERVRGEADAIAAFRIYRDLKEGSERRKVNINKNLGFRELQVVFDDDMTFQRNLHSRGKTRRIHLTMV